MPEINTLANPTTTEYSECTGQRPARERSCLQHDNSTSAYDADRFAKGFMTLIRNSTFVPPELRDFLVQHDVKLRIAAGQDLADPQAIMIQERNQAVKGDTICINETYLLAELSYLQSVAHIDKERAEKILQAQLLPFIVQELGELYTNARIVEKTGVRPPDFSKKELLGLFWQSQSIDLIVKNRESFENTFGNEAFERLWGDSVYARMTERFLKKDEAPDRKVMSGRVLSIHKDLYGNDNSVFENWETDGKRSEVVTKTTSVFIANSNQTAPDGPIDEYSQSIFRWLSRAGLSADGLRSLNSIYGERTEFLRTYAGTETQQRVRDCYSELLREAFNK